MAKSAAPRILIADDQADVLEALRLLLKGEGYQIDAVTSPAAVIAALEARDFDVVMMDLNYTRDTTSGQEGLDLLSRIQAIDSRAAGDRDDGLGHAWTWRWKRCAAARATSCRSRGTTSGC